VPLKCNDQIRDDDKLLYRLLSYMGGGVKACCLCMHEICSELASERHINVILTCVAVYWMPSTHLPL